MDFDKLVQVIADTHDNLHAQAVKALNLTLTIRNWVIGGYIAEYELHGTDRSIYGEMLFDRLSNELTKNGLINCNKRQLYRYTRFFKIYPEFVVTVSPHFPEIVSLSDGLGGKVGTLSPQSFPSPDYLIRHLSYSHFEFLIALNDPLKRRFYELECIKGNWSVRELKRQIGSLYFERSALSRDKQALSIHTQSHTEPQSTNLIIRDPYIFEFLGLKSEDVMYESDLEEALLKKMEAFLLELGYGFCFEARQKRILIGEEYYFVDLVFYHRVLKCHVLIELKVGGFSHECLGQLNTYLNWYKVHKMTDGDNPPVGLLLCTEKNQALVEYACAGMDNQVFVSKYMVCLPGTEEIREFVEGVISDV